MQTFVARPFTCTNPDEQTLGVVLSWMSNNLKSDAIAPVMKRHGFESIDTKVWYPTQKIHNVSRDLCKEPDTMNIFVAIGKKFAIELPYEAAVRLAPDAILAFNEAYRRVNRGISPEEGFIIDRSKPNSIIVTNNTPWPGEMVFGLLSTLGSRFSAGPNFKVQLHTPDDYLRAVFEVTI